MSLLARSVASVIQRTRGLQILELPDEVPSSLLGDIVQEANRIRGETDGAPYALLLQEAVLTKKAGPLSVDGRHLAQYRQGNRLVVCHSSSYRAQATYKTALVPVLAGDFPVGESSKGLLASLAKEIAEDLVPDGDSDLAEALLATLSFAADAYRHEAESGLEWRGRWWWHTTQALDRLAAEESVAPADVWAAFGFPRPENLARYSNSHDARAFVSEIHESWTDPESIRRRSELVFATDEQTEEVRDYLDGLADRVQERLTAEPSLVSAISGTAANEDGGFDAWKSAQEQRFFEPPKTEQTQFVITFDGAEPPISQWTDVVIPPANFSLEGAEAVWDSVSIQCPTVSGGATLTAVGQAELELPMEAAPDGAHYEGRLSLRVTKVASISKLRVDPTNKSLPISECFLCIPPSKGPWLLMRKKQGGKRKPSPLRVVPLRAQEDEVSEEGLRQLGPYEIAIVDPESRDWTLRLANESVQRPDEEFENGGRFFRVQIAGGEQLLVDGTPVVQFFDESADDKVANPLVAAATCKVLSFTSPDSRTTLGRFESFFLLAMEALSGEAQHLGHLLVRPEGDLDGLSLRGTPDSGVFLLEEGMLKKKANPMGWSLPTEELLTSPEAKRLREAYKAIDLRQVSNRNGAPTGTIPSLLPYSDIESGVIEELLEAHRALIARAENSEVEGDAFWARYPFSVVLLESGANRVSGLLLSPLHPIRLAWRWSVERALSELPEGLGMPERERLLELVEGSQFPLVAPLLDGRIGLSVPVDLGDEQVFVGWSCLISGAREAPEHLQVPPLVAGERAPIAASSGLNASAVRSSVSHFRSLHPEVGTLVVDIAASRMVGRVQELDRAVVEAATEGRNGEASRRLSGGLRVRDSRYRDGAVAADALLGRVEDAGKGFKLEWKSYDPDRYDVDPDWGTSHVRFLQDSPVSVAGTLVDAPSGYSCVTRVPLRRVVARDLKNKRWRFLTKAQAVWPSFGELLNCIESIKGDGLAIIVDRVFSAFDPQRPSLWYVAGDAYLDPRSLQEAASAESADLMLWEWRPGFSAADGRAKARLGDRPYVVICRFPERLSSKINSLMLQLEQRADSKFTARHVVGLLGQAGIGLNALLTRDVNHAIGALGFVWAMNLLRTWLQPVTGSIRLCVPYDAVDSLICLAGALGTPLEGRQRADLLLMSFDAKTDGPSPRKQLTLIPVEIKAHGGSEGSDEESGLEQVRHSHASLRALCHADADPNLRSWTRSVLATIVEAGITLNPRLVERPAAVSELLTQLMDGSADVGVGGPVLIEFSPNSQTAPKWREDVDVDTSAAVVNVDAVMCGGETKGQEATGPAHDELHKALEWAAMQASVSSGAPEQPSASRGHTAPRPGRKSVSGKVRSGDAPPNDSSRVGAPEPALDGVTEPSGSVIGEELISGDPEPERERVSRTTQAPAPPARIEPVSPTPRSGNADATPRADRNREKHSLIIRTLAEHRVQVQPPPSGETQYVDGPATVRYRVSLGRGVTVQKIQQLSQEIKLRLRLPNESNVSTRVNGGYVEIEIAKQDGERTFFDIEDLWAEWSPPSPTSIGAPIGRDENGQVVAIDLASSTTPHLLIGGQTGSGKSQALLSFLLSLTHYHPPERLKLVLVDGKRTEFVRFANSPHLLHPIVHTAQQAASMFGKAVKEMERRYTELQRLQFASIEEWEAEGTNAPPHWVLVIDEYAQVVADERAKEAIEGHLRQLAQAARAAGIHIVISTQRPEASVVNANLRSNLPAKLALLVRAKAESVIILGDGGAENLAGLGDAWLSFGARQVRVQCARATRGEGQRRAGRPRPEGTQHE